MYNITSDRVNGGFVAIIVDANGREKMRSSKKYDFPEDALEDQEMRICIQALNVQKGSKDENIKAQRIRRAILEAGGKEMKIIMAQPVANARNRVLKYEYYMIGKRVVILEINDQSYDIYQPVNVTNEIAVDLKYIESMQNDQP